MNNNLLLTTDSYKASHWLQYPKDVEFVNSYVESRGGKWDEALFFGLQIFIKKYLTKPITIQDIDEAEMFWSQHGEPFNRDGWMYILNECGGYMPVNIQAVPEGSIIPNSNVLVQIINTDPNVPWITSFLETALLRAVWYPTTVATNSLASKRVIYDYLVKSADDPDAEIGFKMHDFGARGVSSAESAAIGGCAHLVNFMGTDTVEGVVAAKQYYSDPMAGFSIPASEHSTMTCWGGANGEIVAFRNMIQQFGGPGKMFAVVSDSYDFFNAATEYWGGELLQEVIDSGSTVVIRPDSGDPVTTPVKGIELLMEKVGYTTNEKGYKVLPDYFRVIQGDGINVDTVEKILKLMDEKKLSGSNIAFGQGGGLLQEVNRDTLKFAMKCSAVKHANGTWTDVYKDPVTDTGKRSKRGRLALIINEAGEYETVREGSVPVKANLLNNVFLDGKLLMSYNMSEVRENAKLG